jgi:hypothetical protein
MSRISPDPQIVSLRAMRAGDIAFAVNGAPGSMTVVVSPLATAQPIVGMAIPTPVATPSQSGPDAAPAETPTQTVSFSETTSQDPTKSVSVPAATESQETLAGTPSETPVVTVGKGTSVV